MQDLVWLLLPVAAAFGWFASHRSAGNTVSRPDSLLGSEYIKGLNYLLDEQQDKAIDVFIRMLEVNSDTAETHLALGNLFRKRGEVDRAIRIHQNLAVRPSLENEQRMDALLELGQDYMKAGLFDRAESLFTDLVSNNVHLQRVLPMLLDIYQQERDWENAIGVAAQMGYVGEQPARSVIAQFYCELAENDCILEDFDAAIEHLDHAVEYHPRCARAQLIRAHIAREQGDCRTALRALEQVAAMDIELLPEVLEDMHTCHTELGTLQEMTAFLQQAVRRYAGISPVLVLADIKREQSGDQAAADYIAGELARRPSVRGLARLIDFSMAHSEGQARNNMVILKNLTDQLLENRPVYECRDCGFSGKTLHWKCPGCKHWNTIKPIHGVEAE